MKIIQPRTDLAMLFGPTILLGALAIGIFLKQPLLTSFSISWVLLLLCGVLIFTPWGSRRIGETQTETPRYPPINAACLILLLQGSLFTTFMGIAKLVGERLPVSLSAPNTFLSDAFHLLLTQCGLFPWPLVALIAASFGWMSYRTNQDAYLSTTLKPGKQSNPQRPLNLIVNTLVKQATLIAIASTFALMTLFIATLFSGQVIPLVSGFQGGTIFLGFILLTVFVTPFFKRRCHRLLARKMPIFIGILVIIAATALLIVGLSWLLAGFNTQAIAPPTFLKWLLKQNGQTTWSLFSALWWLAWTPLMAALLARICRGYTLRALLYLVLFFPAALFALLHCPAAVRFLYSLSDRWVTVMSVLGFIILCMILTTNTHLPMTILSYLPARDRFKYRDHHAFFRRVFIFMAAMIYIYLPGGTQLAYLLVIMLTLPMSIALLWSVFAFFKNLVTTRT